MKVKTFPNFGSALLVGCGLIISGCFCRRDATNMMPAIASLMLAHLIADFPLQINKVYYMKIHSVGGLAIHALIHCLVTGFVVRCPLENWLPLVLIGLTHFVIDGLKLRWKGPALAGFLLDQMLHITLLILIATLLPVQSAILTTWLYPALAYAALPALLMAVWVAITDRQPGNRINQWLRRRLLDISQIVGLPLTAIILIAR